MSTHNVCFRGKIKKNIKSPDTHSYLDLCNALEKRDIHVNIFLISSKILKL